MLGDTLPTRAVCLWILFLNSLYITNHVGMFSTEVIEWMHSGRTRQLRMYTLPAWCFFWPCIMNWLYINYQLDALIIIRASNAHLQKDTVVYMQHMVLSLSTRVRGGLSVHSLSENCILLKMSTWGSKHVEENNILWINNNQCIRLVINI